MAVPQKTSQMESEAKRDSSYAQVDHFARTKWEKKVSLLRSE